MRFEFLPEPHLLAKIDDPQTTQCPDSSRIAALRAGWVTEDAFWSAAAGTGTPLIDPVDEAGREQVCLTFVFRDTTTGLTKPAVIGAPIFSLEHLDEPLPMTRIPGTDTWYATIRADSRAVIAYGFTDLDDRTLPDGSPRPLTLDPHCAETYPAVSSTIRPPDGWQPWDLSVARLSGSRPGASAPPMTGTVEIATMPTVAHGERRIFTYLPAGADAASALPWMLLFDGYPWAAIVPIADVLDRLIADGEIPPLAVVMLDSPPAERNHELSADADFAGMVSEELVPWARSRWHLSGDPARTIIAGQSFGGSQAVVAAHRYPSVFGNVLSQSGSFWLSEPTTGEAGWMYRAFRQPATAPLRVYLDVGLYEGVQLMVVRSFAAVLERADYDVRFTEYPGGHDFASWQTFIGDGLRWLTRDWGHRPAAPTSDQRL